jgi:hypothetical protein
MTAGVRVYDKKLKKVGAIQSVSYYDPVTYYQRLYGSWPCRNFDKITVRFDGDGSDTIYQGEPCGTLELESATAGSAYSKLVLWHDFEETAGTVIGDWKDNVHSVNKPTATPATKEIGSSGGSSGTFPSTGFISGHIGDARELGALENQTGNTNSEQDGIYEISSAHRGNAYSGMASLFDNSNATRVQFPSYTGGSGKGQYTGSDDESGTGYLGGWVRIKMPIKVLLSQYSITSGTDGNSNQAPRNHALFGSNDNSTWTSLNNISGQTSWSSNQTKSWNISPGTAYQYYLYICNRVIKSNQHHLYKLSFVGEGYPDNVASGNAGLTWPPVNFNILGNHFDDQTDGRYIVTGSSVKYINPNYMEPFKAFNSALTTHEIWYSDNNYSNGTYTGSSDESGTGYLGEWLKIQMPTATSLTQYTLQADATYFANSPKDWKLFGSNDNSSWTAIDTQTSQTYTASESKNFTVTSSSYLYLLFIFNKSGSGSNVAVGYITFEGSTGLSGTGSVIGTRYLTYNGTSQYALGGVTNIPNDKMSMSFWIKTTATTGTIFSFGGGATNNVERAVKLSAGKVLLFEKNGGAETSLLSSSTVNDNNWHNIVCTIAGISSVWKIYVDSVDVSASVVNGPGNTNLATTQTIIAASYLNAVISNYYAGSIDDLRTYNDVLTQTEIDELYAMK